MKEILIKGCAQCPHIGSALSDALYDKSGKKRPERIGKKVCCHSPTSVFRLESGEKILEEYPKIPQWCPLDEYSTRTEVMDDLCRLLNEADARWDKLREIHRKSDSNAEVAAQVRMMVTDYENCPKTGDPE